MYSSRYSGKSTGRSFFLRKSENFAHLLNEVESQVLANVVNDDRLLPKIAESSWLKKLNFWKTACCFVVKHIKKYFPSRSEIEVKEEEVNELDITFLPLTMLPNLIVEEMISNVDSFQAVPVYLRYKAILFVVDVSGFTQLTEMYNRNEVTGADDLAVELNNFMSNLALWIMSFGGDILSFAGDAYLCQWEQNDRETNLKVLTRRAYDCAVYIQTMPQSTISNKLRVKIGIAVGEVTTIILGSPSDFLLFVIAGSVLQEVRTAEEHCKPGEIVISELVYLSLKETKANLHKKSVVGNNFVKINNLVFDEKLVPLYSELNRITVFQKCKAQQLALSKSFMLPILRDVKTLDHLTYISEVTQVTILFLLLPNIDLTGAHNLDIAFRVLLLYTQKYDGVLNKMLLFDKGCTFLVVFGFPGCKHINDASRAILCADSIISELENHNIEATSGISTGTCFCGIVGHPQRKEYTVIGWRVNLACRLMTTYSEDKIVLDANTYHSSLNEIDDSFFTELEKRKLKGIKSTPDIFSYKRSSGSLKESIRIYQVSYEKVLTNLSESEYTIHSLLNDFVLKQKIPEIRKKGFWPIIIIQGAIGCGKSYLHNYATQAAAELGCEIISFSAPLPYVTEPFRSLSNVLLYFLKIFALKEKSWVETLNKFLPMETDAHIFVLNHLLDMKAPIPKSLYITIEEIYYEIETFLKMIFHQICLRSAKNLLFLAIDDAHNLDSYSWKLLTSIAETENVIIFLTVPLKYMPLSTSASIFYLKSFEIIDIKKLDDRLIPAMICWHLDVEYVHKDVVNIFKAQWYVDSLNLEAFLNSPSFESISKFVSMETITADLLEVSFYPQRTLLKDKNNPINECYVCDVHSRLSTVLEPVSVKEDIKTWFRSLEIQNRMIVKRAAVLGHQFTWNQLCVANASICAFELEMCFSNLMNQKVFCYAFDLKTAKNNIVASKKHMTFFSIQIYGRYITTKPKEDRSFGESINPMETFKFSNSFHRTTILASMTKSQKTNMHLSIARGLIENGLMCINCCVNLREKENSRSSGMFNYISDTKRSSHAIPVDLRKCTCINHKIETYELISQILYSGGRMLLSVKYLIYAAEICIEDRNLMKAISYVEHGLNMLPVHFFCEVYTSIPEEAGLFPKVLQASLYRIRAEAFYYLGNTYKAAATVIEALLLLKMNIPNLIGNPLHQDLYCFSRACGEVERKEIAACVMVLCKTYYKTSKYEIACQLSILCNKLMTSCNSSFIKVLAALCLRFKCKTKLGVSLTIHKKSEESILYSCRFRLMHRESGPISSLELRAIAKAYTVVIKENLIQRKFDDVEIIGQEAFRIFRFIHESVFIPTILSLIIEACRLNRKLELFSTYLNHLRSYALELKNKAFIAVFYSEEIKLVDMLEGSIVSLEKYQLLQCEEFMKTAASYFFHLYMPLHFSFFVSSNFALWSLISKPIINYEKNSELFIRWYRHALKLQKLSSYSYWHISAELTMIHIDIIITFVVKNYTVKKKKREYYRILNELQAIFVQIRFNYPSLVNMWKELIDELYVIHQKIFSKKGTWMYPFEKFIGLIEKEMVLFTSY